MTPTDEFNTSLLEKIDEKLDRVVERITRIETSQTALASQVEVAALAQRVALQEQKCEEDARRLNDMGQRSDSRLRQIEIQLATLNNYHKAESEQAPLTDNRRVVVAGAAAGGSAGILGLIIEKIIEAFL